MSETLAQAAVAEAPPRAAPALSRLEFLPGWFSHFPVVLQWIALGLRHRSFSLPTAANPTIPTGGLAGERKTASLDLVGGPARAWLAPYTTLTTGSGHHAEARAALAAAGLALPVVLKPDIGCNGTGVRLIRSEAALDQALDAFPPGTPLVLQAYVALPGEAGIFYIREPDAPRGQITSITLKYPPTITGDGRHTVRALIEADPRHGKLKHLYLTRLATELDRIPLAGETETLVFAGNHCKGSIFRNGAAEISEALAARIDAIAQAMPGFHFGRFDLRYGSLAALRRGEDFRIIEINGVGAEATHIWDPETTLAEIWGAQLRHFGAAWRIGAALRRRGARTSGLIPLYHAWRLQKRLMRSYPLND